jgi:hypothetical protein
VEKASLYVGCNLPNVSDYDVRGPMGGGGALDNKCS